MLILWPSLIFFFFLLYVLLGKVFLKKYLFVWLHWVLVAAHEIISCSTACGIFSCRMWNLVPWPGIIPGLPALGARSLSHWTTTLPQGSPYTYIPLLFSISLSLLSHFQQNTNSYGPPYLWDFHIFGVSCQLSGKKLAYCL